MSEPKRPRSPEQNGALVAAKKARTDSDLVRVTPEVCRILTRPHPFTFLTVVAQLIGVWRLWDFFLTYAPRFLCRLCSTILSAKQSASPAAALKTVIQRNLILCVHYAV